MSDNFILNASPIILLGKADLLKTISPLAKSWIIPKGVVREVEKKRSIEPFLSDLSGNEWGTFIKVSIYRKTVLSFERDLGSPKYLRQSRKLEARTITKTGQNRAQYGSRS